MLKALLPKVGLLTYSVVCHLFYCAIWLQGCNSTVFVHQNRIVSYCSMFVETVLYQLFVVLSNILKCTYRHCEFSRDVPDRVFTARRFASAVLATAIPSVCLFVTRRYYVKMTARSTVQFALLDSKMCLVL